MTKKDLVVEAVQFYLDARRDEMRRRMRNLMHNSTTPAPPGSPC